MLPAARIAAAIEALDQLFHAWESGKRMAADHLLEKYFRLRRFIGSKDRGAIAELFYWTLRHKGCLEWSLQETSSCEPRRGCAGSGATEEDPVLPLRGPQDDNSYNARPLVIAALYLRGEPDVPALFGGGTYAPALLMPEEKAFAAKLKGQPLLHAGMPAYVRGNVPAWTYPYVQQAFGENTEAELAAMNAEAAVDLRTNALKISRDALLENLRAEGMEAEIIPMTAHGIRLHKRAAIFASPSFKAGYFEMQDAGSQAVVEITDAKPGQKVIDFCAGAGGKTLGLAASMQNKGRLLAWDTSAARLEQIRPRLKRAGIDNVQTHLITSETDGFIKRHKDSADRVLVDAPCSGSGTWRRSPDLKWRFTFNDLQEVIAVQRSLLQSAARLVKPGGRLIYATCSVYLSENEEQIANFLTLNNTFGVVSAAKIWDKTSGAGGDFSPYLRLTPRKDGADGFFVSVLERTS